MTNSTKPNVAYRLATSADHDNLIAMRTVYDGRDYVPYRLHYYLKDETRLLGVAEVDGELVSFIMLQLVDNGQTVIWQAGRTKEGHEQGGHQKLLRRYLRGLLNQRAERPLFTIVVSQSPQYYHAFTTELKLKYACLYWPSWSVFTTGLNSLTNGSFGAQLDRCQSLTRSQLFTLFSTDSFWSRFCPSGFFNFDNEHYRQMPSNFDYICHRMVDPPVAVFGDAQQAISVSSIVACKAGMNMRVFFYAAVDCDFATASQLLLLHFVKHLVHRMQRGWLVCAPLEPTLREFHFRCTLSNQHSFDSQLIDMFHRFCLERLFAVNTPDRGDIFMFRRPFE